MSRTSIYKDLVKKPAFFNFSVYPLLTFVSIIFICLSVRGQIPDSLQKKHVKHLLIYAGIGLGYTTTPSLNDYIRNQISGGVYDSVRSFSAGLEIFGGVDYEFSKKFSIRFDYSYFFKSRTYYVLYFTYDYFYFVHQPFIYVNYIIAGDKYNIRMGVGFGYHFGQLRMTTVNNPEMKYKSNGPSIRAEILFSTKLSSKLNAYVSGFMTGSFLGTLKDNNNASLKNPQSNQEVGLSGVGFGIRLGFSINIF
jgi:hypothetical protein